MILKANGNLETIETCILNPEQKLGSLAFFAVSKQYTLFSIRLKHKY